MCQALHLGQGYGEIHAPVLRELSVWQDRQTSAGCVSMMSSFLAAVEGCLTSSGQRGQRSGLGPVQLKSKGQKLSPFLALRLGDMAGWEFGFHKLVKAEFWKGYFPCLD